MYSFSQLMIIDGFADVAKIQVYFRYILFVCSSQFDDRSIYEVS
jgi:hypothetical protein